MTISNLTKMAESYPNGWKTVGKGEIAHHEQFLLFPQCFQKVCFPEASKGVIVWESVKQNQNFLNTKMVILTHSLLYSNTKLSF